MVSTNRRKGAGRKAGRCDATAFASLYRTRGPNRTALLTTNACQVATRRFVDGILRIQRLLIRVISRYSRLASPFTPIGSPKMRTELEKTLDDLHHQLESAATLDQDQRARLRQAVTEIRQSLDREDVSSQTLASRLREATEQFQVEHPSLTNSVGRVADILSQMGI
ncbi:hypothetical protein V7x_48110 [Crateriforma conspicua]|uniref:DUF4404 domain-containing protein n=1 Tax=Crateriforma conspicua TaxID=2527996 RepID=A0A5C6FRH0_9PLAN|nr:hypothetical protein V7x_48110 [Crateriforma conspicua]